MSLEIGGFIQGIRETTILAPKNENHICRLCGGYDLEFLGYSRMRVSDGSGSIDFIKCDRCKGTGIEPQRLRWIGKWFKPWTWLSFEKGWM